MTKTGCESLLTGLMVKSETGQKRFRNHRVLPVFEKKLSEVDQSENCSSHFQAGELRFSRLLPRSASCAWREMNAQGMLRSLATAASRLNPRVIARGTSQGLCCARVRANPKRMVGLGRSQEVVCYEQSRSNGGFARSLAVQARVSTKVVASNLSF